MEYPYPALSLGMTKKTFSKDAQGRVCVIMSYVKLGLKIPYRTLLWGWVGPSHNLCYCRSKMNNDGYVEGYRSARVCL